MTVLQWYAACLALVMSSCASAVGQANYTAPPPPLEQLVREAMSSAAPRTDPIVATGFFFNAKGDILTNAHAVVGCQSLSIISSNFERVSATLIGMNTRIDAAILRGDGLFSGDYLSLTSRPTEIGKTVSVLGVSAQQSDAEPPMILGGRIGNSPPGPLNLMTVSVNLSPGHSGGPVIDADGYVSAMTVGRLHDNRDVAIAIPGWYLNEFTNYVTGDRPANGSPIRRFEDDPSSDRKWLPGSSRPLMSSSVLQNMSKAVVRIECD